MPQATAVSQRTSMDSDSLVQRVGPANSDKAVPHPETGHRVELFVASIASRVGDDGVTHRFLSSPPRAGTISGVQWKELAIVTARGLGLALPTSFSLHVLGAETLIMAFGRGVVPFTPADVQRQILAALAGAPVAVLAVCAIRFFALRRPSGQRRDESAVGYFDRDGMVPVYVGVLSGLCATPLGFVMLPHLATEACGAWHALVVAATGLGVFGELFLGVWLMALVLF